MDIEKIISTVLGKVGNTDVSRQTIKTVIGLNPLKEGEEPDEAYFDKMADAAKSIQGNINSVFASKLNSQLEAKIDEYKKKNAFKEPVKEPGKSKGDDLTGWEKAYNDLKGELDNMRAERQKEKAEAAKKAVKDNVKNGLKEKFEASGLKLNDFLANLAVKNIDIPEEDADMNALIGTAENLYNQYTKEINVDLGKPRGGGGGYGEDKQDEHEWDDIAAIANRNRPKAKK